MCNFLVLDTIIIWNKKKKQFEKGNNLLFLFQNQMKLRPKKCKNKMIYKNIDTEIIIQCLEKPVSHLTF